MGCGWKCSISIDLEEGEKLPQQFFEAITELDESGSSFDDYFDIWFSASYSFSIGAWAKANLTEETLKALKDKVTFYLYCEDREPDETYEV